MCKMFITMATDSKRLENNSCLLEMGDSESTDLYNLVGCRSSRQGILTEGKDPYNGSPYTNYFRLTAFNTEKKYFLITRKPSE